MTIYLADIHDLMNRLFNTGETSIEGSFDGLSTIIATTANGIAGVGVMYAIIRLFMNFYANQEWDAPGTFKLCLLVALYANCTWIAKIVDNGFKSPGKAIETALETRSNNGEAIYAEYKARYMQALDEKANAEYGSWYDVGQNMSVAISTMVDKMEVKIWFLVVQMVQLIMELVLFFFKLAGSLGSNLLIVFVPLSFALSFIPGFESSGVGLLKFIMTFRLWGAVAAAIKFAAYNLGFFSIQAELKAITDAGYMAATGPEWGIILLMVCFIIMMMLTPMFADALISGSQAGSIFSAASGYAMSQVVNPAMTMVKGGGQGAFGKARSARGLPGVVGHAAGSGARSAGKAIAEKIKKISS